jgi:hypothetical protein
MVDGAKMMSQNQNPSREECSFKSIQSKLLALLDETQITKADLEDYRRGGCEILKLSLQMSDGSEVRLQKRVHALADSDIQEDTELLVTLHKRGSIVEYRAQTREVRFPLSDSGDTPKMFDGLNLQNYLLRSSSRLLKPTWESLLSFPNKGFGSGGDELPDSI